MVKCPTCGTKADSTDKEWKYHIYNVKLYFCKQCKKTFNAYFRGDKLSHTIPKSKKE